DASPVIFTFLRDGVPFYDRGIFMPWKQLLQMGRVKPSPEAIDMYMSSGGQIMERINAKIRDIVMEDLFWALLTPSQAALMMYGIPPTTPKETPEAMRNLLVKKEGILEDKFVKTLEKVLQTRKELEHGTKRTVSGKEMDDLVKESNEFLVRIEQLFKEIEERKQEEQVLTMYEHIITILRDVLRFEGVDSVDEKDLKKFFADKIVKKGYVAQQYQRLFENLLQAKKDYDAKKLTKQEVHNAIKDARELTKILVDHIQRKRGQDLEKTKIRVKYGKEKFGEIVLLGETAYIIKDIDNPESSLSKATISAEGNLVDHKDATLEEFEQSLMRIEIPPKVFIKSHIFNDIKRLFGDDVEILFNY
ncbi:MAG: hypothetical protein KC535_05480, partial [Nanoarchaeota archaeon]|nr:hypothetical protein [Nanoarchaeota archaeon]